MASGVWITGFVSDRPSDGSQPAGVSQEWQLLLLLPHDGRGEASGLGLGVHLDVMGRQSELGITGEPALRVQACAVGGVGQRWAALGLQRARDAGLKLVCRAGGVTAWASPTGQGCEQSRGRAEVWGAGEGLAEHWVRVGGSEHLMRLWGTSLAGRC